MGIYREHFIPANPPLDGRYIVWRKDDPKWHEAHIMCGEWHWPRGEGRIDDVHWYMDLGDQ